MDVLSHRPDFPFHMAPDLTVVKIVLQAQRCFRFPAFLTPARQRARRQPG
jgi:hypothetical protein